MRSNPLRMNLALMWVFMVCLATAGCADTTLMTKEQSAEARAREQVVRRHLDDVRATIAAHGDAGALVVPVREGKMMRVMTVGGPTPEEAWQRASSPEREQMLAAKDGAGIGVWVYGGAVTPPPQWLDLRRLDAQVRTDITIWRALALIKQFREESQERQAALGKDLDKLLQGLDAVADSRRSDAARLGSDVEALKEQIALIRQRIDTLE